MEYNQHSNCRKVKTVLKRSYILIGLACLLLGCTRGQAVTEMEPTEVPVMQTQAAPEQSTPEPKTVELTVDVSLVPTAEPLSTPEPTLEPTPEPTSTPVPKLGVLDGKFADKFVEGTPVLTENSYQSDRVAIFISRVVDDSKTLTNHTFNYFVADVYFQNMEDLRSAPAKSWDKIWTNDWLVDVAKKENAIFAVSGDFTLSRKVGLVIRNGEQLQAEHDEKRDVAVIYTDGRMETYLASEVPVEQILGDETVWQILGFGPELLDANGQPKTVFNDPNQVGHDNIRNAVGYYEPGHYCFVYVPYYKTRDRYTCIDMEGLSQLMHQLGCTRAYNLDGGATAGMFFNGKLVSDKGLGQSRQIHDFYYIPKM